jgi:hypothetical protein
MRRSSVTAPANVTIASAVARTPDTTCVQMTTCLRSNRSEIWPPSTEKSRIGTKPAKFSTPTASAEPVSW